MLLMVPLRRYLIVKEHGVLRYPEGRACASILEAGEKGGTSARKVFLGLGFGALFKAFQAIFGGVKASVGTGLGPFRGAEIGCDAEITLGPLEFDDFIPGWKTAWVRDPEGNIVEISQGFVDQKNPPAAKPDPGRPGWKATSRAR